MTRYSLPAVLLLLYISSLASCTFLHRPQPLAPLEQEVVDTLRPGLLPRYFANFKARNVAELPDDDSSRYKSWLGEPIPQLDNQFGIGEVFGSGKSRTIGIRMHGVLYFPKPGTYAFQTLSNDGVIVYLGDTVVVSDPLQHSDQLSREGTVEIPASGCYPLRVDYFQRKGTAALKLYWKTPGSDTMTIIPTSAYGHFPVAQ